MPLHADVARDLTSNAVVGAGGAGVTSGRWSASAAWGGVCWGGAAGAPKKGVAVVPELEAY